MEDLIDAAYSVASTLIERIHSLRIEELRELAVNLCDDLRDLFGLKCSVHGRGDAGSALFISLAEYGEVFLATTCSAMASMNTIMITVTLGKPFPTQYLTPQTLDLDLLDLDEVPQLVIRGPTVTITKHKNKVECGSGWATITINPETIQTTMDPAPCLEALNKAVTLWTQYICTGP